MGEKRAAATPASIPVVMNAPPGVLGILDDLSSMILGRLATRRKLQAILETLSEHIDVERARFVLCCRLARDAGAAEPPTEGRDQRLVEALRDYPGVLESISRGAGTVVENGSSMRSTTGEDMGGSSLCVPICRGGGIIGLLCISSTSRRGNFRPWEVDFCSILANMAGAALTAAG